MTRAEVGAPPSWPSDDEIALDREVGPGEKERTSQKARYRVVFRTPEGNSINYEPKTLEEFVQLGVGAERDLRVDEVTGQVKPVE